MSWIEENDFRLQQFSSGVVTVSKVKDFLYYFMLTFLVTVATFLILMFLWGANKIDDLYWFITDFIPRTVLFWFFVGIILVVCGFLIYNFVRLIKSLINGDLSMLFETTLTGVPMTLGVGILIHFVFWSGGFESVIENISSVLLK